MFGKINSPLDLALLLAIFSFITVAYKLIKYNEKREIKKKNKKSDKITNSSATMTNQNSQLKYIWTIKNLNINDYVTGQELLSSTFSAGADDECQWHLLIYPKGISQDNKNYVSLFIKSVTCDISANVEFGLLTAHNGKVFCKEFFHYFTKDKSFGFPKFIKQTWLTEKNGLVNENLKIYCELKMISSADQEAQ